MIKKSIWHRADVWALLGGLAFSALFTALIWWAGQFLDRSQLLPDQGPAWYYWQLPEPTFWTRASAWGSYFLHQIAIWGLIYYAQKNVKRYIAGLHPVNLAALGVNAFFIVLHLVQTHLWYDGLAQDVSIFSSQGSVIVLLVWVLLMENQRRGLFFGRKAPIGQEIGRVAREYHGYVFAWATIYTFWYHPMENTQGHLIGFVYTFLLLLQSSLFFTRIHTNRWWTLAQEVTVLFHGTLVALGQAGVTGFWPMFAFGFAGIFVITQMHGLGLALRTRWIIFSVFVATMLGLYAWRGFDKLNEVIRIPLIEYLAVFVLAGLLWGGMQIWRLFHPLPNNRPLQQHPAAGD